MTRCNLLHSFSYLTLWSFILILAHPYTHRVIHLPLLSCLIMIGGATITYADPKYMACGNHIQIRGVLASLLDLVFHIIPFFFVCWKYHKYYVKEQTCNQVWVVVAICVFYLTLVDPVRQYHFNPSTLYRLLLGGGVLTIVLLSFISISRAPA